jgi:hypothetical protein
MVQVAIGILFAFAIIAAGAMIGLYIGRKLAPVTETPGLETITITPTSTVDVTTTVDVAVATVTVTPTVTTEIFLPPSLQGALPTSRRMGKSGE